MLYIYISYLFVSVFYILCPCMACRCAAACDYVHERPDDQRERPTARLVSAAAFEQWTSNWLHRYKTLTKTKSIYTYIECMHLIYRGNLDGLFNHPNLNYGRRRHKKYDTYIYFYIENSTLSYKMKLYS